MGSLTLFLGRASLEKLAEDADRYSWRCFRKVFIVLVHFISAKQNISTYYLVMAAKVYNSNPGADIQQQTSKP